MDYTSSSQKRNWTFTPDQVALTRQATYDDARSSLMNDTEGALTQEEEQQLRVFYIKKIRDIGDHLKYPKAVIITAIQYFQRFYLTNSMMLRDPQIFLTTCLLVASKTEEAPVRPANLCSPLKVDMDRVVLAEYTLLESLNFDLYTFKTLSSLNGLMWELKAKGIDVPDNAKNVAVKLIDCGLLTDVEFIYPPSQIALVALKTAGVSTKQPVDYVESIISDRAFLESFPAIEEQIKNYLKQGGQSNRMNTSIINTLIKKQAAFYAKNQARLEGLQ